MFFSGDTLLLKNGRKIDGRYLSSDADRVQFEVNGKPFTYAVWLIRELRFSGVEPAHDEVRPAGKPQQEAFCQVLIDFQRERRRVASDPNPIRRAQMQPPDPWTFESRLIAVLVRTASFPIGPAGCSSRFRDRAYRLTSARLPGECSDCQLHQRLSNRAQDCCQPGPYHFVVFSGATTQPRRNGC